jgi:hypothetical protein
MKNSYIRFGRRFAVPSTAQILDELKTDFVPGYVPISQGRRPIREQPVTESRAHIEKEQHLMPPEIFTGKPPTDAPKSNSAKRDPNSYFIAWEKRTALVKQQTASESAANDAKTIRLKALRLAKEETDSEAQEIKKEAPKPSAKRRTLSIKAE